jgi:hypothetical protein
MLHHRFWQRRFKGGRLIIGKTLELDHKIHTIIGVTRLNFTWDWGADVYLPQEVGNPQGGGVVVKLRKGVKGMFAILTNALAAAHDIRSRSGLVKF